MLFFASWILRFAQNDVELYRCKSIARRDWAGQYIILVQRGHVAGENLLAVHVQNGQLTLEETPGDPLFAIVYRALALKEVTGHNDDSRIDQPPPGQVEIPRPAGFDKLHYLEQPLPGFDKFLF